MTVDFALERRALEMLADALELPDGERAGYVARITDGDELLRARVQALLSHAEPAQLDIDLAPRHPVRLGAYRLTDILGEGGMGVVYRAERDDGLFEQTVAIKLVRQGLFSTAALERFAEERRLLARLTHPNIARLLDGGVDDAGNSYIVMEYIDGLHLGDWLARHAGPLPVRARVALVLDRFEAVCDAVSAAHRQLVVHADLKPNNVLVTGDGQPKLLDFGVARWLDAPERDAPSPYARAMTRAYAPPERRAGQPPSVAGDVYALGAMLYELLDGALPEEGVRTRVVFDDIGDPAARTEREIEIPKWRAPSTAPGCDRELARLIRGDIDAIVLRALAEAPEQRYPSVDSLLQDLRAWRMHRVPAARPQPPRLHRARLFARRNRAAVGTAALVFFSLLGGALVAWQQYRAAEQARAQAEARFDEARAMSRYMLFDLLDTLEPIPGTLRARADLASTAQQYLDRLAAIPAASVDVRVDTARGYARLGTLQGGSGTANLGEIRGFRANFARAERILTDAVREAPDDPDAALALAGLQLQLAYQEMQVDNALASAERRLDAADSALQRAQANGGTPLRLAIARLASSSYRIELLQWQNRFVDAVQVGERALADVAALPKAVRDEPTFAGNLPRIYKRHGESLRFAGRSREAVPIQERGLALCLARRAQPDQANDATLCASLAAWGLGQTHMTLQEYTKALARYQQATELGDELLRAEPTNDHARRIGMVNRSELALALSALGRHDVARTTLRDALATAEARLRASPDEQGRLRDLWEQRRLYGGVLVAAGEYRAACATWTSLRPELLRAARTGVLTEYDRTTMLQPLLEDMRKHCQST